MDLPFRDPPTYPLEEYFVRCEAVTPKDGLGGYGPHNDVDGIFRAISSSERCLEYLNRHAPEPEEPPVMPKRAKGKKKKEPEPPPEPVVEYTK